MNEQKKPLTINEVAAMGFKAMDAKYPAEKKRKWRVKGGKKSAAARKRKKREQAKIIEKSSQN